MSCLWLLVLLACCGGNDNGCGGYDNDYQRGGRGRNNDCGCGRQGRGRNNGGRGRDNDCGCDRQSRDNDWGCNDNPSRPVFGRSRNNDIRLNAPTVSRSHVSLSKTNGKWYATDLNSTHGTFVNGNKITSSYQLNSGDILSLCEENLRFEEDYNR